MSGKDISLVLGSGGARGYAHIGVIEALERHGYRIRAIAGTSMGVARGMLSSDRFAKWSGALKKVAGAVIIAVGVYFVAQAL